MSDSTIYMSRSERDICVTCTGRAPYLYRTCTRGLSPCCGNAENVTKALLARHTSAFKQAESNGNHLLVDNGPKSFPFRPGPIFRPRARVINPHLRPVEPYVSCRPFAHKGIAFGGAGAQRPHILRSLLFDRFRSRRCLQRLVLSPFRSLFVGNRYRASRSVIEPQIGSVPRTYHDSHTFFGYVSSGVDSPQGTARRDALPNLGLYDVTKKASDVFQHSLAFYSAVYQDAPGTVRPTDVRSDLIGKHPLPLLRLGSHSLPNTSFGGQAIHGGIHA